LISSETCWNERHWLYQFRGRACQDPKYARVGEHECAPDVATGDDVSKARLIGSEDEAIAFEVFFALGCFLCIDQYS
jgi:hypothetical protein